MIFRCQILYFVVLSSPLESIQLFLCNFFPWFEIVFTYHYFPHYLLIIAACIQQIRQVLRAMRRAENMRSEVLFWSLWYSDEYLLVYTCNSYKLATSMNTQFCFTLWKNREKEESPSQSYDWEVSERKKIIIFFVGHDLKPVMVEISINLLRCEKL